MHQIAAVDSQRFATFNLDFLELIILTFILTSMASIHKREKSRFWIASYTSRDGRQLKKSTKTTDKAQATEIAIG